MDHNGPVLKNHLKLLWRSLMTLLRCRCSQSSLCLRLRQWPDNCRFNNTGKNKYEFVFHCLCRTNTNQFIISSMKRESWSSFYFQKAMSVVVRVSNDFQIPVYGGDLKKYVVFTFMCKSMNILYFIYMLVSLSPAYNLFYFFCWYNQSTASFFQDNSVSLAQLIGFRSGDRERMYFPNSLRFEEKNKKLQKGSCSHDSKVQGRDMSRVICIPVLLDTLLKFRNSKKSSRNKDDKINMFETKNS